MIFDELQSFINTAIQNRYIDYCIRLLASLFCGLFLGIERKQHQEIVGIRTLMLISISSCLLSILSLEMSRFLHFSGDSTRIAAGVVSGIGFIGAGAILKQGVNIKGLTTAAIIFCASAMGLCCGCRLYFPAFSVLLLGLFILSFFHKIEHKYFPLTKIKHIKLVISSLDVNYNLLKEIILNKGYLIKDIQIEKEIQKKKTTIVFVIKCSDTTDTVDLSDSFSSVSNLQKLFIYE